MKKTNTLFYFWLTLSVINLGFLIYYLVVENNFHALFTLVMGVFALDQMNGVLNNQKYWLLLEQLKYIKDDVNTVRKKQLKEDSSYKDRGNGE